MTAPMTTIQKWSNVADLRKIILVAIAFHPKFPQPFTPVLYVYVPLVSMPLMTLNILRFYHL
ncbi:hypothetical protein PILCRDRAFT_825332 [Piloderma croceum F 1598]|uniref:Uncharacterized protein n=1 Tax=Piloderma croceum (strain F 1598) TaxID=765440 RepID=A0A0C3EYI8_PILCF|nr:hypothetical protein PILCRDRAFT_825332 [Piloderma croceum F 1598]